MGLDKCIMTYIYYHIIQSGFIALKILSALPILSLPDSQLLASTDCFTVFIAVSFLKFYIFGIIWYIIFFQIGFFFSLNNRHLRFFYVFYWLGARVCVKLLQSCPILCDPIYCNPPGSSVNGILQARILE